MTSVLSSEVWSDEGFAMAESSGVMRAVTLRSGAARIRRTRRTWRDFMPHLKLNRRPADDPKRADIKRLRRSRPRGSHRGGRAIGRDSRLRSNYIC